MLQDLSFQERLALLVDRQLSWRQNLAMQQRLKRAKLRANACAEDIDWRAARRLAKTVVQALLQESNWCGSTNTFSFLGRSA